MQNRENMTKADWDKETKKFSNLSSKAIDDKEESFDRCDTDGFLSQQVLADISKLESARANLCKKQGKHYFLGLFDGQRRLKAKIILVDSFNPMANGKNPVWLLEDSAAEKYGRRFMPYNNAKGTSRVLNSLGLKESTVVADAWATRKYVGWTHYVHYYRVNNEWGEKDQLIKEKA